MIILLQNCCQQFKHFIVYCWRTSAKAAVCLNASSRNVQSTVGETLTLKVQISGSPTPTVTWLKNGQTLTALKKVGKNKGKVGQYGLFAIACIYLYYMTLFINDDHLLFKPPGRIWGEISMSRGLSTKIVPSKWSELIESWQINLQQRHAGEAIISYWKKSYNRFLDFHLPHSTFRSRWSCPDKILCPPLNKRIKGDKHFVNVRMRILFIFS